MSHNLDLLTRLHREIYSRLFTVNECSPGGNGRTIAFHGRLVLDSVTDVALVGIYKRFPNGSILVTSVKDATGLTRGLPK